MTDTTRPDPHAERQTDLNIAFARKDWNMDNQPDASHVEEPPYLGCGDGNCLIQKPIGMHTNGGCRCTHADTYRAMVSQRTHIDALLAANRELAAQLADAEATREAEWVKLGITSLQTQLEAAESRALAAQKALRKASYSFERIGKWREGALAYDRENNNPPRDFCEDVELIEESAKFSKAEVDAAIDESRAPEKPQLICPKCGADRYAVACPKPYNPMACPMGGQAYSAIDAAAKLPLNDYREWQNEI